MMLNWRWDFRIIDGEMVEGTPGLETKCDFFIGLRGFIRNAGLEEGSPWPEKTKQHKLHQALSNSPRCVHWDSSTTLKKAYFAPEEFRV